MESRTMVGETGGIDTPNDIPCKGDLNALDCILFHPCDSPNDYYHRLHSFKPLYVHHFFSNEEISKGWLVCKIHLFFATDTLDSFVVVEGRPEPPTTFEQAQQDVMEHFNAVSFPGGFCDNEEEFLEVLSAKVRSDFVLPGRSVRRDVGLPRGDNTCIDIRLCHFNMSTPDPLIPAIEETTEKLGSSGGVVDRRSQRFSSNNYSNQPTFSFIHRRIEWFMHFFIESCSSIHRDDRWTVLIPFVQKQVSPSLGSGAQRTKTSNDTIVFSVAGMATVYNFFSIPKCRMRISQFFVFPHLQQKGVGQMLMECIYAYADSDDNISEITVEDPAASFVQLRDYVSLRLVIKNKVISAKSLYPDSARQPPHVPLGREAIAEVRNGLKGRTKDSRMHILRMANILVLARMMPTPMPPLPPRPGTDLDEEIREWRDILGAPKANGAHVECLNNEKANGDWTEFPSSCDIKDYRICMKRQLRAQDIDTYANFSPEAVSARLGGPKLRKLAVQAVAELEKEWRDAYISFYRCVSQVYLQPAKGILCTARPQDY